MVCQVGGKTSDNVVRDRPKGFRSFTGQVESATTQIDFVAAWRFRIDNVGVQAILHEATLLFRHHELLLPKHAQVMGDIGDIHAQNFRQFAHEMRAFAELPDNSQSLWISQGLQPGSAKVELVGFFHEIR